MGKPKFVPGVCQKCQSRNRIRKHTTVGNCPTCGISTVHVPATETLYIKQPTTGVSSKLAVNE